MSKNNPRVIGERRAGSAKSARLAMGSWSWVAYESCKLPFILMSIYVLLPYVTRVLIGNFVVGQALWAAPCGDRRCISRNYLAASRWVSRPVRSSQAVDCGADDIAGTAALHPLVGDPRRQRSFRVRSSLDPGTCGSTERLLKNDAHRIARACRRHEAIGPVLGREPCVANMFSVAVLTFMLWAFILPGKLHWPIIPAAPLFGLDQASHQPERLVGPVGAILLILGTLPVLVFSPYVPRSGVRFPGLDQARSSRHLADGVGHETRAEPPHLSHCQNALQRCISRWACHCRRLRGWHQLRRARWSLLSYGILKAVFAGIGAFIAGEFNAWLGPRRALKLELGLGDNSRPLSAGYHAQ